MNRKFAFRSVAFFMTLLIFLFKAANSQVVLDLNFKDKKFSNLDILNNLKEGETYKLQINNVNLYLYNISLVAKDTVTAHALTLPSFGSFDLNSLTSLVGNLTPVKTTLPVNANEFKELSSSNKLNMKLMEVSPDFISLSTAEKKATGDKEKAGQTINLTQDTLADRTTQLSDFKTSIDSATFAVKKYVLSAQVEYRENHDYNSLGGATFSFDLIIKRIETLRLNLSTFQTSVASEQSSYISSMSHLQDAVSKSDTLKKADQQIRDSFDKLNSAITAALASINSDNAGALLGSVIAIDNDSAFTFTSLPIQFNGDRGDLKINITPRDPKNNLQSYSTELKFPWSPKEFARVGSAFYFSTLHDEAYSTIGLVTKDSVTKRDTVTSYKVKRENPGYYEIGAQAMMTFGFWGSDLGYCQFSFGPGVSITNKVRPRLLAGVGYAFGRRNLLTVTFGIIGGSVDVLSNAVEQLDEPLPQKPDQLTVSHFEIKCFFSVGYLFNL